MTLIVPDYVLKQRQAKEKADKERRAKERKEARKEKTKLTKAEKKKKRMQKAAFDRFQMLEDYVDPFGDYTTFAGMSGEDAAKLAGYNEIICNCISWFKL